MQLLYYYHRKKHISDPFVRTVVQNDIRNLLVVPIRINQLLGTFPLSLNKSDLTLDKSWKSNLLVLICLLLQFNSPYLFSLAISKEDYEKMYTNYNKTAETTQTVINSLINFIENICLLIFIRGRAKIQLFYSEFFESFVNLLEPCYKLGKQQEFNFPLRISRLRKVLGMIFFFGVLNLGGTWFVAIGKGIAAGLGFQKVTLFAIASAYWTIMHHFRQLTCYFYICTIMCFQLSFKALGILSSGEYDLNEKTPDQHRRIIWTMQTFQKLDGFVKGFHELFGIQLLSICIVILLPILNSTFEILNAFKAENFGGWELFALASVLPHLVTLILTFFILCDVSTMVVHEATTCVTDFRSIKSIDELTEIQEKIRLFYISTLSNPPCICPGKFFTLGRHILPPALGLMTTYLIVLQQFSLQEEAERVSM
ncbi:unnamed protein product [Orchesella dallaii]|uniref:Gustatory receptor n=1 Tax=Orchesella dallaii TaxID=48710 RepID=A0ABP1R599_9HEXA